MHCTESFRVWGAGIIVAILGGNEVERGGQVCMYIRGGFSMDGG